MNLTFNVELTPEEVSVLSTSLSNYLGVLLSDFDEIKNMILEDSSFLDYSGFDYQIQQITLVRSLCSKFKSTDPEADRVGGEKS
ncbi:MAG: hypothetical protein K2J47_08340 [Ruminococcus sp.]|nr:hypothetical protein [Ruminococcus sp.]